MAESKEKNDEEKKGSLEFPKVFPPKLPNLGSSSIPCVVGKLRVDRALCDLDASVSLIPYSMFHKLHLGPF